MKVTRKAFVLFITVLLVFSAAAFVPASAAGDNAPWELIKNAEASIKDGFLFGIADNKTKEDIKAQFVGDVTVSGTGTGATITAGSRSLVIIVLGDINGDGKIDSKDYLFVKRAILGTISLSEPQLKAACLGQNTAPSPSDYLKIKRHHLGTFNIHPPKEPEKTSLKILTIGNSFSQDGMAYIYQIAANLKVDEIVLGNLYVAGCSLSTHWNNANNNLPSYSYERNTTGTWQSTPGYRMKDAIAHEDWDYIVMQQVSGSSGRPETYEPFLTNLIAYVKANATNPDVKLAWHMTWAYQANSTHADFPYYNKDQMTMYSAIIGTVQTTVATKSDIAVIIPSGTAIQNIRAGDIGDIVTSDGYHLSVPLGRFIAGMTWVAALTDLDISKVTYMPSGVLPHRLPLIIAAVQNAIEKPFYTPQLGET